VRADALPHRKEQKRGRIQEGRSGGDGSRGILSRGPARPVECGRRERVRDDANRRCCGSPLAQAALTRTSACFLASSAAAPSTAAVLAASISAILAAVSADLILASAFSHAARSSSRWRRSFLISSWSRASCAACGRECGRVATTGCWVSMCRCALCSPVRNLRMAGRLDSKEQPCLQPVELCDDKDFETVRLRAGCAAEHGLRHSRNANCLYETAKTDRPTVAPPVF